MPRPSLLALDPTARLKCVFLEKESSEEKAIKLFNVVHEDLFYVKLQQLAWEAFRSNKTALTEFLAKSHHGGPHADANATQVVMNLLEEMGLKEVIANTAIRLYERNASLNQQRGLHDASPRFARHSQDEPIECIRETRISWEQGIKEELLTIVAEQRRPFSIIREKGKLNPLLETNALQSVPRESVRFLFDSEDLLETSVAIRNPNMKPSHVERKLGMVKINLPLPSLQELIKRYAELSLSLTQLGLDEGYVCSGGGGGGGGTGGSRYQVCHSRHEEGEAIATCGNAVDARHFLRRGCPPSLRARIWRLSLAVEAEVDQEEEAVFARLRSECDTFDLLTDELFLHDVQNITDDPRFFVFEEELKECVLCFARDEFVRNDAVYEVHKPLVGLADPVKNGVPAATATATAMPPSAVQPFLGFATYFAPLCYIFRDRVSLYTVSRLLWCKIWCKLNVLSGDQGTLLHVCATFESLLMTLHPRLFLHLVNVGVQPLKVALPWMQLGFVGLLEVDQILHLWDRVVGYQDPTLLAVMAVSVFLLRAEAILCSNVAADIAIMLMEGSRLRCVPMLQMVLLAE